MMGSRLQHPARAIARVAGVAGQVVAVDVAVVRAVDVVRVAEATGLLAGSMSAMMAPAVDTRARSEAAGAAATGALRASRRESPRWTLPLTPEPWKEMPPPSRRLCLRSLRRRQCRLRSTRRSLLRSAPA